MILPIVAYGHPILKKVAEDIPLDPSYIQAILTDMTQTMLYCKGVGLAAPQVNISQRIFIIDSTKLNDEDDRMKKGEKGIKCAFINAKIIRYSEEKSSYEEGCLSIPNIYGNVDRPTSITIEYYNEKLEKKVSDFDGFTARIIQHEYDHIEGILFTELLSPMKKKLIKRKLDDIKKGAINSKYKMKFV